MAKALRMTPARLDLLRAVKAGHVRVDKLAFDKHAFRTDKRAYPTVTHAFYLLLGERLVDVPEREYGRRSVTATITAKGRQTLDMYEEPTP